MREILVISNTAFSVKKFRMHYLEKLAKTFSITICTPDKYKLNKKRKILNSIILDIETL